MARSLFSQLQEILSELWVTMEHGRDRAIPVERIQGALEAAEDYPTDDPELFDETVEKIRECLASNNRKGLYDNLQELAELSRAGATSYR